MSKKREYVTAKFQAIFVRDVRTHAICQKPGILYMIISWALYILLFFKGRKVLHDEIFNETVENKESELFILGHIKKIHLWITDMGCCFYLS